MFYEVDGEMIEVFDANLDYPRHFRIYEYENEYRIRITLNYSNIPEKSITYIQWNEDDTDTIEALFEEIRESVLMKKVWFNELEIWDWTTDETQYYKLIK